MGWVYLWGAIFHWIAASLNGKLTPHVITDTWVAIRRFLTKFQRCEASNTSRDSVAIRLAFTLQLFMYNSGSKRSSDNFNNPLPPLRSLASCERAPFESTTWSCRLIVLRSQSCAGDACDAALLHCDRQLGVCRPSISPLLFRLWDADHDHRRDRSSLLGSFRHVSTGLYSSIRVVFMRDQVCLGILDDFADDWCFVPTRQRESMACPFLAA